MTPISDLTKAQAHSVKVVLTDIDDTLTEDGRLAADAYAALWRLSESGLRVIPVTGRPAGWCDCIARQWPVDAVIGENGALVYRVENNRMVQFYHPSVAGEDLRGRLDTIEKAVIKRVPGARIAKDQFTRMFDLAIDFNEEPPHLGLEAASRIRDICTEYGAQAKISSIHVNTWFGEYDKLSMTQLYLRDFLGIDTNADPMSVFFCGDSPNDEPMFSFFPLSCGVGNVRRYEDLMEHPPAFITKSEFGTGFNEAANILLERIS